MVALSFLELAEEDCFWHAYVFHPCDAASPAQLHLKQDGLCAGQVGSQAVVKILDDCGITGDDAIQVSEVFHCVQVGAIDADARRTVCLLWRGLLQHLSLPQADGEMEVLGCIREVVDNVL